MIQTRDELEQPIAPQSPCVLCGKAGYRQLFGLWHCHLHFYDEVERLTKDGA